MTRWTEYESGLDKGSAIMHKHALEDQDYVAKIQEDRDDDGTTWSVHYRDKSHQELSEEYD